MIWIPKWRGKKVKFRNQNLILKSKQNQSKKDCQFGVYKCGVVSTLHYVYVYISSPAEVHRFFSLLIYFYVAFFWCFDSHVKQWVFTGNLTFIYDFFCSQNRWANYCKIWKWRYRALMYEHLILAGRDCYIYIII